VAVDEPRHGAAPATVELLDVAVECAEVGHAADARDPISLAHDIRVLNHLDVAESSSAQRRR
jgi:hypothetical protein